MDCACSGEERKAAEAGGSVSLLAQKAAKGSCGLRRSATNLTSKGPRLVLKHCFFLSLLVGSPKASRPILLCLSQLNGPKQNVLGAPRGERKAPVPGADQQGLR